MFWASALGRKCTQTQRFRSEDMHAIFRNIYHLVLLEMEKGDWRVLRALRCVDWHS